MISIEIENLAGLSEFFKTLPGRLDEAVYGKIHVVTNILQMKVEENLSGKVLQSKTGELLGRVRQYIEREADSFVGTVFMEPMDAKAAVHELGGTKAYEILPVRARVLQFISKSGQEVFAHRVWHPPLAKRSYLQSALDEMPGVVYEELLEAIDWALRSA